MNNKSWAENEAERVLKDWPKESLSIMRQGVKELILIAIRDTVQEAWHRQRGWSLNNIRDMLTPSTDYGVVNVADVEAVYADDLKTKYGLDVVMHSEHPAEPYTAPSVTPLTDEDPDGVVRKLMLQTIAKPKP